jgi:hypothetical protein
VDRLNFRRAVALLKTDRRRMPMTWGIFRPKLLLPDESEQWTEDRRHVVVLHELAHAKRWDYLTNLVTQFVCALYWFNPLVWFAARQMIAERERACDDIVLRHGARPADYAEQILQIAAGLRPGYGGIAMARPSKLEGRLRAILDSTRNRAAVTRFIVLAALILLAVIVIPLAMLKAGPPADAPSEIQTQVVVWHAIVDGATFESLHSGTGPVEKTNIYHAEMLDASRVLSTLRSAQRDDGLVEFDEHMAWFKPGDPRFGSQQLLTLGNSRQRPEAPGVSAQFVTVGCNRFQASEQLAGLDLTISAYAQFERLKPGTYDFMSGESKEPNPQLNWKGNIEAGQALCVSALLEGNFDRELHHVVFVQAVSSPRDLAPYLRGIGSTALWLANGPEGVLKISREAKAWGETAAAPEAAITASTGPLSGSGVRVVAVSQPGRWPHHWWNQDGNRIKANPAWQQNAGGANLAVAFQETAVEGAVCRTIRTPDDPHLSIAVDSAAGSSEFTPATSVFYFSSSPEKLQKYLDDGGRVDLVIQHGVGPWQEIGTMREGETIEADGGRFRLDKVKAHSPSSDRSPGLILLDGHYDYDPAFDIAIVAVDKQGQRTPVQNLGGVGLFNRREGRRIYYFASIAKEAVARFAILKRPVKEFVFTNLPTTAIATVMATNTAGAGQKNRTPNVLFHTYPLTNPPIIYPPGKSIADLESQILHASAVAADAGGQSRTFTAPSIEISLGLRSVTGIEFRGSREFKYPLAFRVKNIGQTALRGRDIPQLLFGAVLHARSADGVDRTNAFRQFWMGLVPQDLAPGEMYEDWINGDLLTYFSSVSNGVYEIWWTLRDLKSNSLRFEVAKGEITLASDPSAGDAIVPPQPISSAKESTQENGTGAGWGEESVGLRTRVWAKTNVFRAGQSIPMQLEVTNVSEQLKSFQTPAAPWNQGLTVLDAHGNPVPYIAGSAQVGVPPIDLGPHQSVDAKGFDLTDYYYVRSPGRYTVSWPNEILLPHPGDQVMPLPASAPFNFEVVADPAANADGDPIGKLLPLLRDKWSIGTGGSRTNRVRPGSNHEEVAGRLLTLQYNPTGLKTDSGLVWLWLTDEVAAEQPATGDWPPASDYLGKLSRWQVYFYASTNALRAWPTVKEEVTRALKAEPTTDSGRTGSTPLSAFSAVKSTSDSP